MAKKHSSHREVEHASHHGEEPLEEHHGHEGHLEKSAGLHSFKKEADPIAYGQAGSSGSKSDEKKIHSQMKSYNWS